MGTSMSGYVEVREYSKQKNVWFDFHTIPWKRDYRIYAILANVRNDDLNLHPISVPRGLPDDINNGTKYEHDEDAKNGVKWETWVTAGELENYPYWKQAQAIGDGIVPIWNAFIDYIIELGKKYGSDNVRLVVWFSP